MNVNWRIVLFLFLLILPLYEKGYLRSLRSRKDTALFYLIWALSLAAAGAESVGLPMPRPLDWIRAASAPLAKLLP